MTTIRDIRVVKGSVFDLAHLLTLDDTDCNMLLVSSRTLSVMQTLGNNEIAFTVRYADEFLDGNRYEIANTQTDLDAINELVNRYRLEVIDVTCDVVEALQDINISIQNNLQAACGTCGSEVDPTQDGTPDVGPGEPWPDLPTYDTYKCNGANWLVDGLEDVFDKLALYDVDFWAQTTIAAGAALITSIVLTTLVGGWVVVVAGAIIGLITKLILGVTIDIGDIASVLGSARTALVCALYTGGDADTSRQLFLDELSTAGLNVAEVALLQTIMVNSLVNQLYVFNQVIDDYTATTSCASCVVDCAFVFDFGSGSFRYDGVPFVLSSEVLGPNHVLNVNTNCSGGSCQNNWCLEFTATDINMGSTWNRGVWNFDGTNCELSPRSDFPGGFPPLDDPVLVSTFEFTGNAAFTVTLNIKPGLRPLGDGTAPYSGTNDCV